MEIRPATSADLILLGDIDATIESTDYLHLERTGDGLAVSLKVEPRALREKLIESNPIGEDLKFALKQVVTGIEEGLALVAEHDRQLIGLILAQPDEEMKILKLIDVRVDYDFRRQGLATAMVYQAIQTARDRELRAVQVETKTNNLPSNRLFEKLAFELSGLDLRRHSNHDLVKERATIFWYAALD